MRVFVVGTGRCGSSTFYQLARTVEGMTAGHETLAGIVHDFDFPDNHIEVAAQLVYGIPKLVEKYPDARWVHLIRDRQPCIDSLARQCWDSMQAFTRQWFLCEHPADVVKASARFYDLTNDLIRNLIPRDDRSMVVWIDQIRTSWSVFAAWLDLEYDRAAAADVITRHYNPGVNRGRDNFV